ncbi:MAG TPA: NADH-quinone oxidoreductase subunit N [Mycobacteriales bacterium]|jgi:NADH-quinone oxidoreductase subunit N|nr:NADH-quinone oxidoreductase subunit N [Mycobacteriales bacterium]
MSIDYVAVGPVLVAALGALAVLVVDLVAPLRTRTTATFATALLAAGGALAAALAIRDAPRSAFCSTAGTGAPCSYTVDPTTARLLAVLAATALVVLLLPVALARAGQLPPGEYGFLVLCSLAGALTLAGARDFLTFLVGLETLTLPTYALVALRRRDPAGAEAAVKYLLVSVTSTAVTLLGVALLYGVVGSLHFGPVAAALELREDVRALPLTAAAVVLVLGGLAFKVAAVPFHWWAPDVYQGAPVPVAAYLATVSKAGGVVGLVLVTTVAFGPYAQVWAPALAVLAVASMTWGNLVALRQRHAVRLLAWSSVAHTGYLLVPLAAVGAQPELVPDAVRATVGYLAFYLALTAGAFACVVAAGVTEVADFRGLARRSPLVGGALAVFLLGLAGLPPALAGLVAKVVVLRTALLGGAGWLAVAVALNTVVGLAYYLRLAAAAVADPGAPGAGRLRPAPSLVVAVGGALVVVVVLSVVPQLALDLAR